MLRWLSIAAVLAVAAVTVSAQAGTPADDGRIAARAAWVKLSSCSPSRHNAVFYARMRRLAPEQRLWMRFTLLERGEASRFVPVEAPGLRRWRKSKPGVKAFGYRQRVRGLAADSAYRARVDYRWYEADGELARKQRRRSRACSQSPLPNLRARITGSTPTALPGIRRYGVRLANAGHAAAGPVAVSLTVEGSSSETKSVARLAAGEVAFMGFRAPDCTSAVRAEADPAGEIRESSETDNSQRLTCADVAQAH